MRDVVFVEDCRYLFPERARLAWRAVVGRSFPHEVEAPRRTGARGVEEIAIATDLIGALEARAELTSRVIVEERRGARTPGQRALFEPEHENDLVAASARPEQVDDRGPSLPAGWRAHLRPLERGDDILGSGP